MAVVSDKYKYVFNAARRVGGRSVSNFLVENYDGQVKGYPKHKNLISMHHDRIRIPGYLHFGVVRNPYFRMLSIWKAFEQIHKTRIDYCCFLSLALSKTTRYYKVSCQPQCEFYRGFADVFIDYDNLDEDISNLPFISKKVRVGWSWIDKKIYGNSGHEEWKGKLREPLSIREHYTQHVKNLLMKHSGGDFRKFKYSTELPDIDVF
jgi:hypothetical protein